MRKDTCGTTAASSIRQACTRWGCPSCDGASRRSSMAPKTMRVNWSSTWPAIWLRERRKARHRERLLLHLIAKREMQLLNLRQIPLKGRDRIGHFEVLYRQVVAATLII